MGPEKRYEEKIKRNLQKRGAYFIKFFANGYTKKGVPDILCCYHGVFLGIEVKGGTGYGLTDQQKQNLDQIREAGGVAVCVYPSGWDKLMAALDMIEVGGMPESGIYK